MPLCYFQTPALCKKRGGEYCQSQRVGEGRLSNLSLGPTGRLGGRLSEPAAEPAGTCAVNRCLPDPVWPNAGSTFSLLCPALITPHHELLRSLHTRQHVKLLCFWKHTHTRREALKFFLELIQGFIYEIPRGWERQKSGLRRLSAAPSSYQHNQQLPCAFTKCPLHAWARLGVQVGHMHSCSGRKTAGMPSPTPISPPEEKTNTVVTYFDHNHPSVLSPTSPHFLTFWLFSLSLQPVPPLPFPLWSP